MAQTKKKTATPPQRKQKTVARIASPESDKTEHTSLMEWQSEVEALTTTEFATYDDAMNAFIDNIVSKLPRDAAQEEREFIATLFEIDPEFTEGFRRAIKIAR